MVLDLFVSELSRIRPAEATPAFELDDKGNDESHLEII
jgi:hypothetical protein